MVGEAKVSPKPHHHRLLHDASVPYAMRWCRIVPQAACVVIDFRRNNAVLTAMAMSDVTLP